jgi:hypothetical protein
MLGGHQRGELLLVLLQHPNNFICQATTNKVNNIRR